MAHHKRGKPKNARAGCLMCKPHKINGAPKDWGKHKDLKEEDRCKYEERNLQDS